jgi:hypothetical protein
MDILVSKSQLWNTESLNEDDVAAAVTILTGWIWKQK